MNRLSLVLLPALASVVALTQTQTADISWRPKVGAVTKHRMTVYMGDVKAVQTSRREILRVNNDSIVLRELLAYELVEVQGSPYPTPYQPIATTWTMRPDGTTLATAGYDPASPRAWRFEGVDFFYPSKVIQEGGTWTHENGGGAATFTFVREETLAGLKVLRVAFTLVGGWRNLIASATGTYWLRPEDGVVVKALGRCRFETDREGEAFDGTFKTELVD